MMASKRPIPSTHGRYLAGRDGTIWRRGEYRCGRWVPAKRIAASVQGSSGRSSRRGTYLKVNVNVNGVKVQRAVHRLVAEAWLDGYHPLYEVHHVNGDPLDNRAENLMLVNRADHERLHGKRVTDYDAVNCQVDLEMRMAHYEQIDAFSDGRRARERASTARRGRVNGSSSRRNIEAMARRVESLSQELDMARKRHEGEE